MAARRQHQESQQDVLCLEGPPGDGPNIGQAYNAFDTLYSWNGDVVNMKANGYGIWCRRFARFYGKMVDGAIEGSYVVKYFSGAMKFFCNDGTLTETAYDRNNPIHKDIVDMAQARADIAHARVMEYKTQNDHVLRLEGPPGNGVNVGVATANCETYKWEGDVRNGKANGYGRRTWITGDREGLVTSGKFKDGIFTEGVVKLANGNPDRSSCIKGDERADEARKRLSQPWSQSTNHFPKWKPKQEIILTVMLVAERFHRRKEVELPQSLRPLPVEIWGMILQICFDLRD
eukprot:m.104735 g.104735  ORF g.104735 m.104735 type:complete len:289 (-) comp13854_c0_seq1:99-965(-)